MAKLCRICFCSPNLLIPIFNDTELSDKIRLISSVVIKENDGFPDGICVDCITKVDMCYNFRLVLINSDAELKRHATDNVTKIDEEPLPSGICEMIQWEQGDSDLKQSDDGEKTAVAKEIVTTVEEPDKQQTLFCDICSEMIEMSNFNRHLKRHTNCDVYAKVFNNPKSLRQHKCGKHDSKICELCGKLISHKSRYQHHLKEYHEGAPKHSSCSICYEIFVDKKKLERHQKMHKRSPICKVCEENFPTTKALMEHKRKHNHRCELCSSVAFNSK